MDDKGSQHESHSPEVEKKGLSARAIAIITAVVILVLILGGMGIWALSFQSSVNKIKISEIDLGKVPDGKYTGTYSVYHVKATVRVTVQDHKITKVQVVKMPSGGEESVPAAAKEIIEEQSLAVDTTTGASIPASEKVMRKAVERALENAQ